MKHPLSALLLFACAIQCLEGRGFIFRGHHDEDEDKASDSMVNLEAVEAKCAVTFVVEVLKHEPEKVKKQVPRIQPPHVVKNVQKFLDECEKGKGVTSSCTTLSKAQSVPACLRKKVKKVDEKYRKSLKAFAGCLEKHTKKAKERHSTRSLATFLDDDVFSHY
ncbi:uncharacterized protein LOC135387490 [Ornithodoros turicata]|uniref:uncharacterized protein LOC135387490 n=1 Tax=Ornithodoros turicata TaxID=34597 RepID=UPI00313A2DBC